MTSQGNIYDIVRNNIEYPGFGVATFLFTKRVSQSIIRGNLQIRFGTSDALDKFINSLLNENIIEDIEWNSGPRVYDSDNSRSRPSRFGIDDVSESLDGVLLNAYKDTLIRGRTDELLQTLSKNSISRTARIIAAIVYQRSHTKSSFSVNRSFIWKIYNLIETQNYEKIARRDVLNELVDVGCVARDGSDIYTLPEFKSIETPENYLPLLTVSDEWES